MPNVKLSFRLGNFVDGS